MLCTLYARMAAVGLALSAAFFLGLVFALSGIRAYLPKAGEIAMIACLTSSAAIFCAVIVAVVVRTRLYRGPRYALRHNGMATRLRYDLLDAGVCARRDWPFFGQFDQLPKFRISFADDFCTAKLEVENSTKADKSLMMLTFQLLCGAILSSAISLRSTVISMFTSS